MNRFSKPSMDRLLTCHQDLQRLFFEVIKKQDCSILCGFRDEKDQDKAFNTGKSKLQWPHSKHNSNPSMAVDVAPYPIDWVDTERFKEFAQVVLATAQEIGVKVVWGGHWEEFPDLPHFELAD